MQYILTLCHLIRLGRFATKFGLVFVVLILSVVFRSLFATWRSIILSIYRTVCLLLDLLALFAIENSFHTTGCRALIHILSDTFHIFEVRYLAIALAVEASSRLTLVRFGPLQQLFSFSRSSWTFAINFTPNRLLATITFNASKGRSLINRLKSRLEGALRLPAPECGIFMKFALLLYSVVVRCFSRST